MLEEAAAHLGGGTELLSGYRSWGRVCDLANHRMLVFSLNYPIWNSSFNSQRPDKGGEGGPGGAGEGRGKVAGDGARPAHDLPARIGPETDLAKPGLR